jgi:carboxymethylenebutenolidase
MKNEKVAIKEGDVSVNGYIAYPEIVKVPAVIVIHEIYGVNENIREIADRFAAEGYVALAPDLMEGSGVEDIVSPDILREVADPATRDEAQKKMRAALSPLKTPEFAAATVGKLEASYRFLRDHPAANGAVGVVGFCLGGTYAYALAAAEPKLKAMVAFYGQAPRPDDIEKIMCPMLAFYGEKDANLITGLPVLDMAMQSYGKQFRAVIYPDVGHAFFNDKNPVTYNADAALRAWNETKQFLLENL